MKAVSAFAALVLFIVAGACSRLSAKVLVHLSQSPVDRQLDRLLRSFHISDRYLVTQNRVDRVDVTVGQGQPNLLSGQQPGNITDRGYVLRDDELARYGAVSHQLGMLTGLMEQVYIRPQPHPEPGQVDSVNPNTELPWFAVSQSTSFNARDTRSSASFWAVPLVLAFQGFSKSDPAMSDEEATRQGTADPSNYSTLSPTGARVYHGGLLGVTYPAPNGDLTQPRSVSFVETMRDFKETNTTPARATVSLQEMMESNAAHEVLHSLSLDHSGGIMCAARKNDASDPMRFSLTRKQLSALRRQEQPKWPSPIPPIVCGTAGAVPPDCCP